MDLSFFILVSSGIAFAFSFLIHLYSLRESVLDGDKVALTLTRVGFLLTTFYFAVQALGFGRILPLLTASQAAVFFAWCVGFVYLVFLTRPQNISFGLVLNPVLLFLVAVACFFYGHTQMLEGLRAAQTHADLRPFFVLHIVSAYFAYASFTISFAASILFLIQQKQLKHKRGGHIYHKLPSIVELEALIFQPILWGVPLLFISVVIGFFWAQSVFGSFWLLEPKTFVTGITLLVYLGILYLRRFLILQGRQTAWLSLLAFTFVVAGFVATRFYAGFTS